MSKSYDQFRYSDWEWIVVHFPPTEREDMARTAWLIAECPADEIAKHKQLDPRIIIPLCAIQFQDEINWELLENIFTLEKLKYARLLELISYSDKLLNQSQEIIEANTNAFSPMDLDKRAIKAENIIQEMEKLANEISDNGFFNISEISDSNYWKNLFYSLELNLQFNLIYILSKSARRPDRNDWRDIFQEVKYEFKISWHYRLVIVCTFLFFIFAIIAMIQVIFKQRIFWINGLTGLALYIITFWVFPSQNPQYFIKFALLGLLTFKSILNGNLVKSDIKNLIDFADKIITRAITGTMFVAPFIAILVVMFATFVGSAAGAIGRAGAWDVARDRILAVGVAAWAVVGAVVAVGVGVVIGILLTMGILILYGRKDNKNYFRILAIVTFPLFCWFPILVTFATIFLLNFFSWQHTLLIWLISLGTCTGLWLYGQDKERKARNPLKGILEISN